MANEEHLAILRQGVEMWNEWRKKYPAVQPDLTQADLQEMDLRAANFQGVSFQEASLFMSNLGRANLVGANFRSANLQRVRLQSADLLGSNLRGANLQEAILFAASLQATNLRRTNLRGANLLEVNLVRAKLQGTNLEGSRVGSTIFANVDLRGVRGLDMVHHSSPSTVGIDTLYLSKGEIPEVFLRGCGVPDSMIEYARALVAAERPMDYYSCFISYSSQDEALAERLYADLQSKGVRCWYAPHDMQIGEPILSGIDRGIRLHDKLLLILSESSVESGWVEQEVLMALAREKTERRRVLFPIRIDNAVIESRQGWPAVLRETIHLGDFRQWKDHDAYQAAFARLLRDLKAEQAA
ncbi:MAG TPA: toll/interleukin-1 receptor domain-containing protein [Herpetosiphonaceae bacterium]